MDKNKKLSIFSTILAIILSVLMSVNVFFVYRNNLKNGGSSNAASVAFLVAIRYIMMILATLINSYILWNKSERK